MDSPYPASPDFGGGRWPTLIRSVPVGRLLAARLEPRVYSQGKGMPLHIKMIASKTQLYYIFGRIASFPFNRHDTKIFPGLLIWLRCDMGDVCVELAEILPYPNLARPEPKSQTQKCEEAKSQSLLFFSLCDRTAPIPSWSSRLRPCVKFFVFLSSVQEFH